jgi:hypothetical protein
MRRLARTAALCALLSAPGALGAPSSAPPPPLTPPAAPPQALDLAALAARSKTVEIAEDQLRAALVQGKPDAVVFSGALDLGGGVTAIAWSECSKAGCRGSVATLTSGTNHPKLVKKAALVAPAKVFFDEGFAFEPPALADLDGDGAPEIILHYSASEPPRAALGSLSHEYVAVHAPADLSLIFSHEVRRVGGDSEEACRWTLDRGGDRLIANGECNQRACLESTQPSAGCKPPRKLLETWRKPPGQKSYARVANAPAAPTAVVGAPRPRP